MATKIRDFSMVVAATRSGGIGKGGTIPWRLPKDMAYFKMITTKAFQPGTKQQNAVIMGRKTWESIPAKFRPLPDRVNVVLTRQPDVLRPSLPAGVDVYGTLDAALTALSAQNDIAHIFVIGGGQVYAEALAHTACANVFLTEIDQELDGCDTWFPALDKTQWVAADHAELERVAGEPVPAGKVADKSMTFEFVLYQRRGAAA
ncbi:hypothetical protein GGF32_004424 [Allomyces javanicus]|nr:hypothetical protein GGF32_004424 [Allomyces javanicus]